MAQFNLIVADPPWGFSDSLSMSEVKRGSIAQYRTMTDNDIIKLSIDNIIAKNALLALWVPGSKLQAGLDAMKSWGFNQKQIWTWVKTKRTPLGNLIKYIKKNNKSIDNFNVGDMIEIINKFDINEILAFGMGHLFRQTHEICLIGVRGKITGELQSRSKRSVYFDYNIKHSKKTEGLQNMLDEMFIGNKLELFARRARNGWTCVGIEVNNEDINDSIIRLKKL